MHQVMLSNSSAVPSPSRWNLRILVLLLGITILHLWAGPSLSDSSGTAAQSDSGATLTQQVSTSPAVLVPADVPHQSLPLLTGPDLGQNILLGDVCAAACPDGHAIATALCSMVLAVAGFVGLQCLRALFFLPGSTRTPESLPPAAGPPHWNSVSLLQLSISRI
jgi:hypothetical protein